MQIKHRYTESILFEDDGATIRETLVAAVKVGANLAGANLTDAYLAYANLTDANLTGANLTGANLTYANLTDANLTDAKATDLAIARTRIIGDGLLIGWKQCKDGVIVKLSIPEDARRSHAWGRKCRAEFADVLEVFGAKKGISLHDEKTEYIAGQRVRPDSFDADWTIECAPGIHFYISRIEAENHI